MSKRAWLLALALLLTSGSAAAVVTYRGVIFFGDGSAASVSAVNTGAIRYNNTTHIFEQSVNGGSWIGFAASTGNWTFSANNADLTAAGVMGLGLTTSTGVTIKHLAGGGNAPTIAASAATQLGTGPSASIVASSTDNAGTLTITTGTAPAAFVASTPVTLATITFSSAYSAAPKGIVLTPASANAAITVANAVYFWVEQSLTSTTQFVVRAVAASGPSLGASTAYSFAYVVIQ